MDGLLDRYMYVCVFVCVYVMYGCIRRRGDGEVRSAEGR